MNTCNFFSTYGSSWEIVSLVSGKNAHVNLLFFFVVAGFMPQDFYNLDSAYGTEDQLKTALATLHKYEMYIILDVVLHQFVDSDQACQAAWNKAGTILDSVSLTTPLFCIHSFFIFFCNLLKLYISSHPTLYFVFSFFFSYVRFILYIQDSILVYRSILFRFYYIFVLQR